MNIQIISEGSTPIHYMKMKWGLSILIDGDLLFDTFCDGRRLCADFKKNTINPGNIRQIVLSHEHWDHTGGLWYILENSKNVEVYVCKNFSAAFKDKIIEYGGRLREVSGPVCVKENIFSTGEIKGNNNDLILYEQSLIIKQNEKIAVITGCSHPGIYNILQSISTTYEGKIDLLLGGMHLINKSVQEISEIADFINTKFRINSVVPLHCTGINALDVFKNRMPEKILLAGAGDIFNFNPETSSWQLLRGK